jgi:Na+/H+-dicarboxylate symporter
VGQPLTPIPAAGPPGARKRVGPGTLILLGMLAGVAIGAATGERAAAVEPIGALFIRLLMLAAIPLVFFNLLAGLTALTDARTFGRLSARVASWFAVTTAIAIAAAALITTVLRPGAGMTMTASVDRDVSAVPTVAGVVLELVPTNVFKAFADGNVLQLVVIAILLGIITLRLPEDPRDRLRQLYADLAVLFRRLVDLILLVAPVGIGALMAVATGRYGALLFGPLTFFVAIVWGTELLMVGLYLVLLRTLTKHRPFVFLMDTWAVWATTLATTSSLASLSVALDVADRIGLPRPVYSFTLPLGAQVNKDGTAIFLAAVLLFTAQAAGVTLSPGEMGSALLLAFLLSAGSGGIPGGGFVVALIMVKAFGLPLEMAAVVGGIYRLIDMGNTTVNVMGDMVCTALVSQAEEKQTWI